MECLQDLAQGIFFNVGKEIDYDQLALGNPHLDCKDYKKSDVLIEDRTCLGVLSLAIIFSR